MLTARQVESLSKPGRHHDGAGLFLQIAKGGSKSFVFIYRRGRTRMMGIGRAKVGRDPRGVSLAEAREAVAEAHRLLRLGIDPIEARDQKRDKAPVPTFKELAEGYIDAKAPGWRNPKTPAIWRGSFAGHVYQVIGALPVDQIGTDDIEKVLKPIWAKMPETASRVRSRIAAVLDSARAKKLVTDNAAHWKTIRDLGFPAPTKVRPPKHRESMPYAQLPKFMAEVAKRPGIAARALQFTILTAARTAEVITAEWSEIDLDRKVWIVPAAKMKTGVQHHVPLSEAAIAILKTLPRESDNKHVFVGGRRAHGLSNVRMLQVLQQMRPGLTVHGFRSTFRTWAAERTNTPREVAESALSHAAGGKVELAYMRSDFWAKRKKLATDWARFASSAIR